MKTKIVAILNVTPDSFSDGGKYVNIDEARKQVEKLINEGADIIDVGGESTRPGADFVSIEEEIKRVVNVIKMIKSEFNTLVSIDTYKSEVAEASIQAGADIINDVWGNKYDGKMLNLVKKYNVDYIAMHNSKEEQYTNGVVCDVIDYFNSIIEDTKAIGIDKNKLILDPGIGFAKDINDNLAIMNNLAQIRTKFNDYKFLLGTSRKRFIGTITNEIKPNKRVIGTTVTTTMAANANVDYVRVHDVLENKQAILMTEAINEGKYE